MTDVKIIIFILGYLLGLSLTLIWVNLATRKEGENDNKTTRD